MIFIKIILFLAALAVIFIVFMLSTTKQYPEEWERVYEEELLKKFKEQEKK